MSIEFAREDFVVDHADLGGSRSASRDAALLNLPLEDALTRITDDFSRRYCVRLMALENEDLVRAAERAGYTAKGLRELLRRVGLRAPIA